jgi:tRNA(Ile)-lysidine synthase
MSRLTALPNFLIEDNWQDKSWPKRLGIAVSGGGDSVALAYFLSSVLPAERLAILHFDHNLRDGSAGDAAFVRHLAESLGIACYSAAWQQQPEGNMQQAARKARYTFFKKQAEEQNLDAIAVAHTEDDVAETVLMRLGKGSGLAGLTGLRGEGEVMGVHILRPLLNISRGTLRTWLVEQNIAWREDPSNENEKFQRIRIRNLKTALEEAGIPFSSIAASAKACQRAKTALDMLESEKLDAFIQDTEEGVFLSNLILNEPDEIALNVLGKALLKVSQDDMAPRTSKRARALEMMRQNKLPYELGGVRICASEKGVELVAVPLATIRLGA